MDFFTANINLILFLPLIMCLLIACNSLTNNKLDSTGLFSVSTTFASICLIFSIAVLNFAFGQNQILISNLQWLSFDSINFYFGTLIDKTSSVFLALSAIIALIIQIYAFLKQNRNYAKLLFCLNLFFLGLNGIFVSSNIFQSYLFCEILGVACYLLISFDFSNREQSKAGIKSFIYNRIGDLTLLFCVLTILYFAVIYNELTETAPLGYTNLNNIAMSVNSLMNTPLYVFFCSLLLFVVIMKFVQAFSYLIFSTESKNNNEFLMLIQNTTIAFVGIYLFLRLDSFFFILNGNWPWIIPAILAIFLILGIINKIFIPLCKFLLWIEKYIVETIINLTELIFRALSYCSLRLQVGNFQAYVVYSIIGLITIFLFVFVFYVLLIKV